MSIGGGPDAGEGDLGQTPEGPSENYDTVFGDPTGGAGDMPGDSGATYDASQGFTLAGGNLPSASASQQETGAISDDVGGDASGDGSAANSYTNSSSTNAYANLQDTNLNGNVENIFPITLGQPDNPYVNIPPSFTPSYEMSNPFPDLILQFDSSNLGDLPPAGLDAPIISEWPDDLWWHSQMIADAPLSGSQPADSTSNTVELGASGAGTLYPLQFDSSNPGNVSPLGADAPSGSSWSDDLWFILSRVSNALDTAGVFAEDYYPRLVPFFEFAEPLGPVFEFVDQLKNLFKANDPGLQLQWASGLRNSEGDPITNRDGSPFTLDASHFSIEDDGVTSSWPVDQNIIVGGGPSDDFDATTFSIEEDGVTTQVPISPGDNKISLYWATLVIPPLQ